MLINTISCTFPHIKNAIVTRVNKHIDIISQTLYYALLKRFFHIHLLFVFYFIL